MEFLVIAAVFLLAIVTYVALALCRAGSNEDRIMLRHIEIPDGVSVKNIQPDMNTAKQKRKAIAVIEQCLSENDWDKAFYALVLFNDMLDSIDQGTPRPWSEFLPMLEEEFS
jgi:hypothetical protein